MVNERRMKLLNKIADMIDLEDPTGRYIISIAEDDGTGTGTAFHTCSNIVPHHLKFVLESMLTDTILRQYADTKPVTQ